jgi:peptidyl-prolyl cis-trans isomerase C
MSSTLIKKFTNLAWLTVLLCACSLRGGPATATATPSFTSTPALPTSTPVPAVATVNGEVVPLAEYQEELARYKSAQAALGKTVSDEDAAKTVLDDMIDQTLLAQNARAAGLSISDADLQSRVDALTVSLGGADQFSAWQAAHGYSDASFRAALRRSAEAALMRDMLVASVPSTAEQVHVRQILLYNADEANSVLIQLKGGATFDTLAAKYDPVTSGDLGWFPQGYLLEPAIEQAAFALQPGQFSEVIQTQVGYHILFMIERGPHALSPDALLVLQDKAVRDWLSAQRAQAQIVVTP